LRRGLLLAPLVGHLPPEESGAERHVRVSLLLGRSKERLGGLGPSSGRWTQLPKRRLLAPGVAAGAGGRRRSLRCVASAARTSEGHGQLLSHSFDRLRPVLADEPPGSLDLLLGRLVRPVCRQLPGHVGSTRRGG